MERIRSFIAIELDEAVRTGLGRIQGQLKERVELPVRWVRPEGIHLTLKFLGDVDGGKMGQVEESLATATATAHPFSISLNGVGVFPSLRRPRVLWVGLVGELDALAELQRRVETEMEAVGFPAEGRGFQPHLTLGRVRQEGPPKTGWDASRLEGLETPPGPEQVVERVSLMRSDLKPSGAVHTRLAAFPLM